MEDISAASVELLRELLDREQIRDLVYNYSFYADSRDPRLPELFTEDCHFDLGPAAGGPVTNREAMVRRRRRVSEDGPVLFDGRGVVRTSHNNPNVIITFGNADNALVKTSVCAWHLLEDGSEPVVWGYYDDEVTRTAEGWRFARRVLYTYGDVAAGDGWNPGTRAS